MKKRFAEKLWSRWLDLPDGQRRRAFAELFISIEEELHYNDYPVEALFFFERLENVMSKVSGGE